MSLNRTPLFDWHSHHGGRMVEFGGWEMPVQYSSIVDEHLAVRNAVGLFDISHMGRLSFSGSAACGFLDDLLTCRVDNLVDGQIRYGLVCNEDGGVMDDVLVNRVNETTFGLVVNASNRGKIVDWIERHAARFKTDSDLSQFIFEDRTCETAMIAIQGPNSSALVERVTGSDVTSMPYYSGRAIDCAGIRAFVSRTGYTGSDGFELISPGNAAIGIWEAFLESGVSMAVKPCGLGCRDTLRLEAAMPLYGHELTERIDPLTAGVGFAVKLDKPHFIGQEALRKVQQLPKRNVRVGLKLVSRRIAREHSEIFSGEDRVGEVTSGTFSPTLEQSICMAYVLPPHSQVGTRLFVDIRGKREEAEIVKLPFYSRLNRVAR